MKRAVEVGMLGVAQAVSDLSDRSVGLRKQPTGKPEPHLVKDRAIRGPLDGKLPLQCSWPKAQSSRGPAQVSLGVVQSKRHDMRNGGTKTVRRWSADEVSEFSHRGCVGGRPRSDPNRQQRAIEYDPDATPIEGDRAPEHGLQLTGTTVPAIGDLVGRGLPAITEKAADEGDHGRQHVVGVLTRELGRGDVLTIAEARLVAA